MADPYSKAIIQNGLQQRLLCQTTKQIDCKRRKALNQIWFDRREVFRDLVCIRTKTPSLSAKSTSSSLSGENSSEADRLTSSSKSLGSTISSISSDFSEVSASTDSTLQSNRTEKRLKPKQRRKSVTLSAKTVKRIEEVNSIHCHLEKLSLAIEQRAQVMLEQRAAAENAENTAPTEQNGGVGSGLLPESEQTTTGHDTSRRSRRDSTAPRTKRSLSS